MLLSRSAAQAQVCDVLKKTNRYEPQATQAHINLKRLLPVQTTSFAAIYINSETGQILGKAESQPDLMARAASLPKIAILLGLLELKKNKNIELTLATEKLIYEMTRRSNNRSSTELIGWIGDNLASDEVPPQVSKTRIENGKYFIQQTLIHYNLFDDKRDAGLFLGKAYGNDPRPQYVSVQNGADSSSQAANATSVVCFYYQLLRGDLPETELIYKYLYAPTDEECFNYRQNGLSHLCSVGHGIQSTSAGLRAYQKGGSLPRFYAIAEGGIIFYKNQILIVGVLTHDNRYSMRNFDQFVEDLQNEFFSHDRREDHSFFQFQSFYF